MPDDVRITKVKGVEELQRELKRLSSAAQTRLARNAAMAGARVVARHARVMAPGRRIRDSIKARRDPNRNNTTIVAYANARHPLSVIFEYSKQLARYTKAGRYSGILPAQPFMRPALDEHVVEVREKILSNLANGITREVKKQQVPEDDGEI